MRFPPCLHHTTKNEKRKAVLMEKRLGLNAPFLFV
jgi:hypothetical protein